MHAPDPLKQRKSCRLGKSRSLVSLSIYTLLSSVFPHFFFPDALSAVPPPSHSPAVSSAEAAREPLCHSFAIYSVALRKRGTPPKE